MTATRARSSPKYVERLRAWKRRWGIAEKCAVVVTLLGMITIGWWMVERVRANLPVTPAHTVVFRWKDGASYAPFDGTSSFLPGTELRVQIDNIKLLDEKYDYILVHLRSTQEESDNTQPDVEARALQDLSDTIGQAFAHTGMGGVETILVMRTSKGACRSILQSIGAASMLQPNATPQEEVIAYTTRISDQLEAAPSISTLAAHPQLYWETSAAGVDYRLPDISGKNSNALKTEALQKQAETITAWANTVRERLQKLCPRESVDIRGVTYEVRAIDATRAVDETRRHIGAVGR